MPRRSQSRTLCTAAALLTLLFVLLARAQSPPLEDAELGAARTLLDQRKLPEAEAAERRYLDRHAASAAGHYLLAYTLFREDKPRESLAEYTHAAQLQKPTAADLRNVALDYVLLDDYADADKWLSTAVAWAPNDAEAWYDLGRVRSTENRFADALACFQKSLALSPRSVKAEDNLGVALEGLNRMDEAIAAYRQAIAWQANAAHPSEQPLLNLGVALLDRGQLDEARPLLEQAAAIAPKDAKILGALGRLYERKGDLPRAQIEFEQATAIMPNVAALHFQLGQVYRREGMADKAKAEFARAAALDATHSSPERPLD